MAIMPVSKRTRYEVLKRDNHTCRYCGGTAPDVVLTIDHVTPVALGGGDDPSNLVTACRDCNYGKSSMAPDSGLVEDVKQIDLQWAEAMKRAAKIQAAARRKERAYVLEFEDQWKSWGRPAAYDLDSIARLYVAGLPKAEMLGVVSIAMTSPGIYDRFSYFMGICWKRLAVIQETAKQLLATQEADGDV